VTASCGTDKNPGADHAAQLHRLRWPLLGARLRFSAPLCGLGHRRRQLKLDTGATLEAFLDEPEHQRDQPR
jgi:hypothetical protein